MSAPPACISTAWRRCCGPSWPDAGVEAPGLYSSHSLRRGFANWASGNGWDVKTLMEYVGWKDVQSAMRYVDASDPFAKRRIEQTLLKKSDTGTAL